MKRRLLDSFGVAMALAAVVVVFPLAAAPALGQTTDTTAWGHPDLEGIWLDVYDTPLERAPELGDREFATAEERAARDEARRTPGRNIRGPRGSAQDVSGAYNAVFSSAKPAGPRTSLVVDPPNGRIPATTSRGATRGTTGWPRCSSATGLRSRSSPKGAARIRSRWIPPRAAAAPGRTRACPDDP